MDKKIILGLVGLIASGKGAVAEYLKQERNADEYRFSTILRDILERLHFDITRENLQKLSYGLRSNLREDILAKVITEDAEQADKDIVIVDGIRRWADITHLKEKDNFVLVGIDADSKKRYNRLVERAENEGDSTKTYEQFLEDEKKEADADIPDIIAQATEKLDNNGTIEDLHRNIENLLNKYGK